jgi:hypothetical protein
MKPLEHIIRRIIAEQEQPEAPVKRETDNAPKDAKNSPFTPAEEKFLGKFDAYGTNHIGILYSKSNAGIEEFIARSGRDLNLTPEILNGLIKRKIISIVPYGGFGRNNDYTIQLNLSLNAVKGLGADDKAEIEKGSSASGAAMGGGSEMPPAPAPEVAWVVRYGDILKESVTIAKQLISEKTKNDKKTTTLTDIAVERSRILKRLPKGYVYQLNKIIDMIDKKTKTANEKQRIIADILDTLQLTLKLDPKDIRKSYEFHKNQKRLQKSLEKSK